MATRRLLSNSLVALFLLGLSGGTARASIAYGSINNFDTVNDTGVPCHGFEIELDDIHSTDITYTYDWNHYGTPKISEDIVFASGAWHTNVFVRYAAVITNGVWSAYTAVPTNTIAPTQGHQFTNPSLNFGGEHFGVGYRRAPTTVKYNWLTNSGGVLVHGPPVNVATPTFTYFPPVAALAPQVQAAIVPPPPPVPDPLEFGAAFWVKEIRTTSHNNNEVKLRDLVSPDTNNPSRKDWRNGEPDEVEVEWQILQVDHNATNGGVNGELKGAPQNLPHGDDVITRRYEFYQYAGPLDPETGEALAQSVGPDGLHGGTNSIYTNTIVVGKFYGSQMSAYDVAPPVGLIDHLPDGEVGAPYPGRIVVIAPDTNFTLTTSGSLADGMAFDTATGQVYGTPRTNGVFMFHVEASSSNSPVVTKTYLLAIAAAGVILPPHSSVVTSVSPLTGGTTTGDGVYTNGTTATVTATTAAGFQFVNWTENSAVMSTSASYQFTNMVNQSLVANFVPKPPLSLAGWQPHALVTTWPTNFVGFSLKMKSGLGAANWVDVTTNIITAVGTNYQVTIPTTGAAGFFRLVHP